MDPLTLMLIGGGVQLITGLVGTGLSMDAAAREADENSRELYRSANLEQAKALDALRQGQTGAARQRMRGGMLRAEQAVGFAASGFDASTGTPAAVGAASEVVSELDAATIENNAVRAAFGFRESARAMRRQAANVTAKGQAAQQAGVVSMVGQVGSAIADGAKAKSIYGRG